MLLQEENAQLQQAVHSHATVDQALGVLIAVHRLPPEEGWEVLRAVSQHLNIKLHLIADEVIGWALGRARDRAILERLDAEVEKHKCAVRLGGGHPRTRPDHLGGEQGVFLPPQPLLPAQTVDQADHPRAEEPTGQPPKSRSTALRSPS
ncbi:ANTAR domain-containing protein [Streptomyces capitiformicae]|nr:ANTAR domain-containing protein [Streptomyces capitiformicae]